MSTLSDQRKINWGIIGPGRIAHDFASDMRFSRTAHLKAVASRSIERSQDFAAKFDVSCAYGSYDELFEDASIDIIYIAVPHAFHAEVAARALKAGKAVLCEKPLTVNLAQTTQLTDLAVASGQYLMEGMWTYFLPAISKAKQWIEQGKIGKIRHVLCDFGWVQLMDDNDRWYNPALAGGALLDMGCYNLSMANFFINDELLNISATAKKASTGVDKEIYISMMYGDTMASLMASFEHKLGNSTIIVGEEGHIVIPEFWRSKSCQLYKESVAVESFNDESPGGGFQHEIEAVSQDILGGQLQSTVVPHDYSKRLAGQMDEILEMVDCTLPLSQK